MSERGLGEIWVYLSASPLLGLTETLAAYLAANHVYERAGRHPLANPVAIAVAGLLTVLAVTDTPYEVYFEGAQFVHFLLGPATVALAVPLYRHLPKLRAVWVRALVGLLTGILGASLSAVAAGAALGASRETVLSLAPKSVTAPVAMGISEKIGGLPTLTAVLVVTTGILCAVVGQRLFDLLGIRDQSTRGIAMGVTSHGIGTARAFQLGEEMGAFSGLAMALGAFATALILPWVLALVGLVT